MTLKEAIKILDRHFILHLDVPRAQLDEASKLGIEAMKKLQWFRDKKYYYARTLLPGETEG